MLALGQRVIAELVSRRISVWRPEDPVSFQTVSDLLCGVDRATNSADHVLYAIMAHHLSGGSPMPIGLYIEWDTEVPFVTWVYHFTPAPEWDR